MPGRVARCQGLYALHRERALAAPLSSPLLRTALLVPSLPNLLSHPHLFQPIPHQCVSSLRVVRPSTTQHQPPHLFLCRSLPLILVFGRCNVVTLTHASGLQLLVLHVAGSSGTTSPVLKAHGTVDKCRAQEVAVQAD